jgi:hypothetical protein
MHIKFYRFVSIVTLGYSGRGVKLTSYLRLVPSLRMRGTILPQAQTSSQLGVRTPCSYV